MLHGKAADAQEKRPYDSSRALPKVIVLHAVGSTHFPTYVLGLPTPVHGSHLATAIKAS